MPLDLEQLFTALGRVGLTGYTQAQSQATMAIAFSQLAGYPWINPTWIAQLAQTYDSAMRGTQGLMGAWTSAAQSILMGMVAADNPNYGQTLPSALQYLYNQMIEQAATVPECQIGYSVNADLTNLGAGSLFVTTRRGDGYILQNTIAETGLVVITNDSFTGGSTAGREPWQWSGSPNVSSLQTGIQVGLWDWDWPQGSGSSASGSCISASQEASTSGNLLKNGTFGTWASASADPSSWFLEVGSWGTTAFRSGTTLSGSYAVGFAPGATLNALTHQFNSSATTGESAGTTAALTAFVSYAFNVWLATDAPITAGVLIVSLVDDDGTVINDFLGNPNTHTVDLTALSTAWTPYGFAFRTPVVMPSVVRLKLAITTPLAGGNVLMDWMAFARPTNLYVGGPSICLFSDPTRPFEARPEPDGYELTFTNDRAGAAYGATIQTLVYRLFQTASLILPYGSPPTISDELLMTALHERRIVDSIGMDHVFDRLAPASIQPSETIGISDTVLRLVESARQVTDSVGGTDSATASI